MKAGYFREGTGKPCVLRIRAAGRPCTARVAPLCIAAGRCDGVVNEGAVGNVSAVVAPPRAKRSKKVTCEECFFARNGLCALELDEACATFRPYHPDGLKPPTQMRFVFRQERRRQAAWAFPSAQEQAQRYPVSDPVRRRRVG